MNSNALLRLDKVRLAIEQAKTLPEVIELRDQAAAIEHYARVAGYGLDMQNEAAEFKLRAERKAGEMLGGMPKHKGAATPLHDVTALPPTLEELGIERIQSHRWQQEASVPEERFERYVAEAKGLRQELTSAGLLRLARGYAAILESGKIEWWTPRAYIDAVHEVMGGIDLDPASCEGANRIVQAQTYYTEEDDGLSRPWFGRVFLNPPYGRAGPPFVEKLITELEGDVTEAIILVNSRSTDADWFGPLFDGLICFTDHRIDFDSPDEKLTSSTHGSCFVYFGPHKERFAQIFGRFGNVVRRWPS